MINQGKTYPNKAAFGAELDRLTGVCLRFRVAVQAQQIQMETATWQSAEAGLIGPADYEMVRLALLSNLGKASGPSD